MRPQVRLLLVPLDVVAVGPGQGDPVQVPQVVAGGVLAVLAELDAEPVMGTLVQAGDERAMCTFILRNRRQLFNKEQWLRIDTLLSEIPLAIVETDPELLMIKVWIGVKLHRDIEVWKDFGQVEELIKNRPGDNLPEPLLGEIDVILSWRYYLIGDGNSALKYTQSAVQRLPDDYESERGYAVMMVAVSLQMVGRESEGLKLIYDTMERERHKNHSTTIPLALHKQPRDLKY